MLNDEKIKLLEHNIQSWINDVFPVDSTGTDKLGRSVAQIAMNTCIITLIEYEKINNES